MASSGSTCLLRRVRRPALFAAVLVGFAAVPARAQFDLLDWTLSVPSGWGGGTVDAHTMYILGSDDGGAGYGCNGSTNSFTAVAPIDLTLVADVNYVSHDWYSLNADPFVTIVGAVETPIAGGTCTGCQVVLTAPAGSTFGFGVRSTDCEGGPGEVTLTNLFIQAAHHGSAISGGQFDEEFGSSLAPVGDVDGDGLTDLLIGAPMADGVANNAGRASVHSSRTGLQLAEFEGTAKGDEFGTAVGAGDVDGDGLVDFIVGAPHSGGLPKAGAVSVFSGAGDGLLYLWPAPKAGDEFGAALAYAGDVDGDGFGDVLIGAPTHFEVGLTGGMARIQSGADGSILFTWGGAMSGAYFGKSVASAGDVDADGVPDVIVGAPLANGLAGDSGCVQVFSGSDGALLHTFNQGPCLDPQGDQFGTSVAGIGDVDGDGFVDLAVGARFASCSGADDYSGGLFAFSGLDGSQLFMVPGSSHSGLGFSVAGAGDVDGDGQPDIVAGAISFAVILPGMDKAYVYSGDGQLMQAFTAPIGAHFGAAVAGMGDLDGDGLADVAIAAPGVKGGGPDAGKVLLMPCRVLWTDLGFGLAGSLPAPQLEGEGLLAGGKLGLTLLDAPAHARLFLVAGLDKVPLAFKGGTLVPQPDMVLAAVTNAAGSYRLFFDATGPLPSGQSYFVQSWIEDSGGPAGFSASSALRADVP